MFPVHHVAITQQPFRLLDYWVDNKVVVLQIRHIFADFWNKSAKSGCGQNETDSSANR